jgi:hypothetical protein
MTRLLAILVLTLCAAMPVAAQDMAALEAAEQALDTAWDATPLSFRKTLFVTEAPGFGVYTEKPAATFTPGEPIIVYAEPVGYAYKTNEDGSYNFGMNFDLTVKSKDGEIMGGQENFAKVDFASHAKNREFLVTLTLSLNDAPPGDYVLEYLARDANSAKTASISLPFTIAE